MAISRNTFGTIVKADDGAADSACSLPGRQDAVQQQSGAGLSTPAAAAAAAAATAAAVPSSTNITPFNQIRY